MRYTILEQFDVPATYVYAHLYYWEEDDSVSGGHSSYAYCWNSWFPGWTIEDWSSTYYPHGPDYVWIEVEGEFQNDLNIEYEMKYIRQSWIQKLRRALGTNRGGMSRMYTPSTRGGTPIRQTKLSPDGLDFSEDVSEARWVEESFSAFGTLRSLLPDGFAAYARIFHPAHLNRDEERPVRWSTVASWIGRAVHPLMQFERIAGLSEDDMYKDPPWGSLPKHGSIPERECRTLVEVLRSFTSTPGNCFFCLWEGYGNIDTRLYKASSRVRAPGRAYLLFRGPIDAIMAFITRDGPFWGHSPNIWWPEDRAWCVATDIDLFDTYVGGSEECIEAVLSNPDLEALLTTLDARLDLGGDTINAKDVSGGCG